MLSEQLDVINQRALAERRFLSDDYKPRHVSPHDKDLHTVRHELPYFGYVDVKIAGVPPFVMFSNNDDLVAQTYFWFGPNSFESLSLSLWGRLAATASTIFDIGAFSGVYSLAAARVNPEASIHAFEPVGRIFGRLILNLKVNRQGRRVSAHQLAASDVDGESRINLFQGHLILSSGSSLVEKESKDVVSQETVQTIRMDRFVQQAELTALDLVKIDVEQFEEAVIAGMLESIGRFRPDLVIEILSRDNLVAVDQQLRPLGYHFVLIDDARGQLVPEDIDGLGTGIYNVLFTTRTDEDLRALNA